MKRIWGAALALGWVASSVCWAERAPVLGQIDLPHPYYYREMYLPQLTGGPSSLVWTPDSGSLIYSMAGSLWRQRLGSGLAEQLTAAAAYDYQPDCSPDGRWVIYTSYRGDALELWVLDLQSGATHALTHNGAVNLEPRFSPDGKRLVFVSTLYKRRFHIFTADFNAGTIGTLRRLTGEHQSGLPRYYYSAYDHEISPVWTRDGAAIVYVSNRGHIYGTGGFWRTPAIAGSGADAGAGGVDALSGGLPDAAAQEFHYEETNWKARPDISPDGSRIVYSSYTGRPWGNLWLMPAGGGDADFADLWGLGSDQSALVARRDTSRLHFESKRRHRNRDRRRTRRRGSSPGDLRAAIPASSGKPAARFARCPRRPGLGARQCH